ncbi:MAG: sigma-70 family RNA polymerase sigma factor [Candidatus Rokubacteria bacterium]|nr:sigma-70 family RNA polymerase sigma factor [Candidatus Rokubacteria bacterium]
MSRTDDQLMAAVRAGEASAFTELYERHGPALLTFLARLTSDRALAEDLLQETFVRVYRARDTYGGEGQFRAWLFTIARRLVIDWRRSRKIAWSDDPAALETTAAPTRADDRADVRDLVVRLERALRRLPDGQREVVLLSRHAGLDAGQIAEVTGSTPGAVRVSLHRALQTLSELLDEAEDRRTSEPG